MTIEKPGSFALAALLAVFTFCCGGNGPPPPSGDNTRSGDAGEVWVSDERALLGTRFRIEVLVAQEALGRAALEAAFGEAERVEARISEWHESSELSAVNRLAGGGPVTVGDELFSVLRESLRYSALMDGAFDVTFAACGDLWSVAERRIPTDDAIASCLGRVGYERVALDESGSSVYLPYAGMQLGLGGIRKGYAIDRAAETLRRHGVSDYVIDGGGDLRLERARAARSWAVEIRHPRFEERTFATIQLDRGAVVTSGDYQWYFDLDGVRYHHIIDPRTGRPARRSVAVTVIAPSAMEADALSTGLFVMGPERGLQLVERLNGVEALFFGPDLEVSESSGFPRYAVPRP